MFNPGDETRNSDESKKQEAGLVHQGFLSFIECIVVVCSLSVSQEQEKSIPKIFKCLQTQECLQVFQNFVAVLSDIFFSFNTIKRQT